ncbi:MAG: tRNA (adenosine(37)-N6)-threonylcarbamoyltransferase complex transferase subunit TsaD [Deltaproteobacteria bacterium]|nr:tRNA (adenosine(37)-N6)-threonylcarbamoyltransferase complex transferase subunit TsaD [Deltaproteobacteria bacterium]
MIILGIESSCDETAAAVYHESAGILSSVVRSQIADHAPYGGVIPELAARKHIEAIVPITEEALKRADVSLDTLDGIVATFAPGLVGALLVGLSFAKALAWAQKKPFVGVHHLEGHLLSPFLGSEEDRPHFPFLGLIVSGGHTSLYKVIDYGRYELLGKTVDDAAGEALDKAGKLLGLPYPGGIAIDKLSQEGGNPKAYDFPIGLNQRDNFNFSFSGLKTALVYTLKKVGYGNPSKTLPPKELVRDLAASFQEAVVQALVRKAFFALEETGLQELVVTGGVAANSRLREVLERKSRKTGIRIIIPDKTLCTDNAAMIAYAGFTRLKKGQRDPFSLNAVSRLALESL